MASKLHDGSRWEGDNVVEDDGTSLHIRKVADQSFCLDMEYEAIWVDDALAVIRHANLDPLAIAAKALRDAIRIRMGNWCSNMEMVRLDDIHAELQKLEELLP